MRWEVCVVCVCVCVFVVSECVCVCVCVCVWEIVIVCVWVCEWVYVCVSVCMCVFFLSIVHMVCVCYIWLPCICFKCLCDLFSDLVVQIRNGWWQGKQAQHWSIFGHLHKNTMQSKLWIGELRRNCTWSKRCHLVVGVVEMQDCVHTKCDVKLMWSFLLWFSNLHWHYPNEPEHIDQLNHTHIYAHTHTHNTHTPTHTPTHINVPYLWHCMR